MNKKLKSALCGALVFVTGSVGLSACSVNFNANIDDPVEQEQQIEQKETTINILSTDAKTTIMQALAMDGVTNNRNLLEKWGSFTVHYEGLASDTTKTVYTGDEKVQYNNGQRVEYTQTCEGAWEGVSLELYYDGEARYVYKDGTVKIETSEGSEGSITTIFDQYIVGKFFSDETFNLYNETVEKKLIGNSSTLTLEMSMQNLYKMMTNGAENYPDDSMVPTEIREKQGATLTLTFNNGQINQLKYDMRYAITRENGNWFLKTESAQYVKDANLIITAPTWYNIYKA